jgi:Uma2 family endonuclease
MTQHKWHKEIKAWADGAEIEWWNAVHERWEDEKEPTWCVVNKYRIKPQPKEPQYLYAYWDVTGHIKFDDAMYPPRVYFCKVKIEE